MDKEAFLAQLRGRLSGLREDELEERIAFYGEMIDDRMDDGATEADAVAGIGTVDSVVAQIMSETPLTKLVHDKAARNRNLKGWQIALLILGAPLWLPLVVSAAALLLSVYAVIWSAAICLYAADLSLAAGAVAGLAGAAVYLRSGNPAGALLAVGAAMVCAGLAILLFFASNRIAGGIVKLTGRMLIGLKTSLVGKEV